MVKEYERGELWEQFAAAVTRPSLEEHAGVRRLVMKVLDEARYRLSPGPAIGPMATMMGRIRPARRR